MDRFQGKLKSKSIRLGFKLDVEALHKKGKAKMMPWFLSKTRGGLPGEGKI